MDEGIVQPVAKAMEMLSPRLHQSVGSRRDGREPTSQISTGRKAPGADPLPPRRRVLRPRVEAQVRRRAAELLALLRGLD
jgi:hypothetical protein